MHIPLFVILIIAQIESRGNESAYNAQERARGILQITPALLADVNRITGKHYTPIDCYYKEQSFEIFRAYIEYYCTESRIGHKPTFVDAARIWNGGPDGWKKEATKDYGARFEALLSSP